MNAVEGHAPRRRTHPGMRRSHNRDRWPKSRRRPTATCRRLDRLGKRKCPLSARCGSHALTDTGQTVILTFALGTAAGDLTCFCFDLGFVDSALLFGAAILVPCVLHRFAWLDAVAAF